MATPCLMMMLVFLLMITTMKCIPKALACEGYYNPPLMACEEVTSYLKPCSLQEENTEDTEVSPECCEGVEGILEYMVSYGTTACREICSCIHKETDLVAILDKLPDACDNSLDLSYVCSSFV
ncbi:hypothetical protein J5N97_014681 [Dioscorea zingiberensis]|uniref:Bifunctional inhibitor/plant lipid transfer protein/seed storage helical domain-containing protein n=1 Tax=Dioscorea zingiberensis TaxID=325984 RepID=A0A9D5CUF3_9LILI|nr:hypothetical protein J5N97_014681 [Dioscorea zingiberensis]